MGGLVAFVFGVDRALAALLLGAQHGETLSVMAALANAAGKRWGCIGCRFLSRAVQPKHCDLVLVPGPTPMSLATELRAGVLLIWLALLVCASPFVAWRLLCLLGYSLT